MLANLGHLDWLRVPVVPPVTAGHDTYRLDQEPGVEVVWTYAEQAPDGSYRHTGGGTYDPATDCYSQGAFNADDIARAAVVYLRHWQATGWPSSRRAAYHMLRGLTYLQTLSGPNAGNVVLWMQADGRLNPSAWPVEQPDPSDAGPSAWLARTIWALGEGYAAFRADDPPFATFLQQRLRLAIAALRRQVLCRYGEWHGAAPAWLIDDGADLTGEALLGLCAYVHASGDDDACKVVDQFADGVAAMTGGSPWAWPFGAVLPHALSRDRWHAWAGLAPAGLAMAYRITGNSAARDAALTDTASFTPHLLATSGPDNERSAAGVDGVQIAYGAHSRIEALLATASATDRPALRTLAGVAGAWFFGNNPAGAPMYDQTTGRTYDGIDVPGLVHHDAGAESTIHGLLAMLALDGDRTVAAVARVATPVDGEPDAPDFKRLTLTAPDTGDRTTLIRSLATRMRSATVGVPGAGWTEVIASGPMGDELEHFATAGEPVRVLVPAGGFAVVYHRAS